MHLAQSLLIEVAELWPRTRVDRIHVPADAPNLGGGLLYIPLPRRADLYQLDEIVPPALRRSSEAVVFRAHSPEADALLSGSSGQDLAERLHRRFEGRAIWVLERRSGSPSLTPLPGGHPSPLTDEDARRLIAALRHAELLRLTNRPGVRLPVLPDFHYRGPNGSHYASFIRLGPALQSIDAAEGICFWLLDDLRDRRLIVTDSWTTLALGYAAARYSRDVTTTSSPPHWEARIECVRGYGERDIDLVQRLMLLRDEVASRSTVLSIVSVGSSGRLARRVKTACADAGLGDVRTVSLFGTPSCNAAECGEIFARLGDEFERHDARTCPMCRKKSALVIIDPTTYLLAVSAAVQQTDIKRTDAESAFGVIDRYRGTGFIRIHRQHHDGSRHHCIDVDVDALLAHSAEFRQRLSDSCARLRGHVDLGLVPGHTAARNLAALVQQEIGIEVIECDEVDLPRLGDPQRTALTTARQILLIDDVTISGTRLRGYRGLLARAGFVTAATRIRAFVGIARPDGRAKLRGIMNMFDASDGVPGLTRVEELILPDWDRDQCPWCIELDALNQWAHRFAESGPMSRRRQFLTRQDVGLQNGLFLHWSSSGTFDFHLGPASMFAPQGSTDAELFASVASALQSMRSGGDRSRLDEDFTQPVAKVLNPDLYLTGRFYDDIIRAAILRAARPHDLRAPKIERRLVRAITRELLDARLVDLRSEMLWAIAQEKLPIVPALRDAQSELFGGERGVAAFLQAVLENSVGNAAS